MPKISSYIGMIWVIAICLLGCTPQVEEIQFGKESCVHCKMLISDVRFGAELVNQKGKVFKFDALECMIAYMKDTSNQGKSYAYTQAIGYDTPGKLHDVKHLSFFISADLPSPMGANLSAYKDPEFIKKLEARGKLFDWKELAKQQLQTY